MSEQVQPTTISFPETLIQDMDAAFQVAARDVKGLCNVIEVGMGKLVATRGGNGAPTVAQAAYQAG